MPSYPQSVRARCEFLEFRPPLHPTSGSMNDVGSLISSQRVLHRALRLQTQNHISNEGSLSIPHALLISRHLTSH